MSAQLIGVDRARAKRDRFERFTRPEPREQEELDYAHTVVVQAEQIAAVRALHPSFTHRVRGDLCARCFEPFPCSTLQATGVEQ